MKTYQSINHIYLSWAKQKNKIQ